MTIKTRATVDDLYRTEGKAELVNGELVLVPATGRAPGYASDEILVSLKQYVKRIKKGIAVGDNKAFLVELPHRQSFSPDVAYYVGPNSGMKFFEGAPTFAVEVRSEGDYGRSPEREMAAKRAEYFAAGTQVVWDVDVLGRDVVRVYRPANPDAPAAIYRKGDVAEAEPAVPGWTMPVDDLFEST
jgi:Uma2 family endonuclease